MSAESEGEIRHFLGFLKKGFDGTAPFEHFPPSSISSGGIAQLGEHLICIQKVAGSIPVASTSFRNFEKFRLKSLKNLENKENGS